MQRAASWCKSSWTFQELTLSPFSGRGQSVPETLENLKPRRGCLPHKYYNILLWATSSCNMMFRDDLLCTAARVNWCVSPLWTAFHEVNSSICVTGPYKTRHVLPLMALGIQMYLRTDHNRSLAHPAHPAHPSKPIIQAYALVLCYVTHRYEEK